MYPAQFVEQGSLDVTVGKVAEVEVTVAHEPGIEIQGGSCPSSASTCQAYLYPSPCAGEVISIQTSLLFAVYMCYVCDVCVCFKVFVIVA